MNRKSIKWKWLIAIISIILLLSTASFLTSALLVRSLNEETIRNNESKAEQMRNSLDDSWDRIFKYSWQIFYSEKAKQLESKESQGMTAYEVRKEFDGYLLANPMIDDCYLYYPESDLIIGTKGVMKTHAYWMLLFDTNKQLSCEDWTEKLFGTQVSGYFTIQTDDGMELYYRISKAQSGSRVMVAKINRDELQRTLNMICEENNTGLVALVDGNGKAYAAAGNTEAFLNAESNTIVEERLKDCLVTKQQSDISSLYYLTVTENSTAYEISNNSKKISAFVLILAVAMSVVLAVQFVRKGAKPVELLMERFPEDDNISEDELNYLGHKIDDLLDKNRKGVEKLIHQQDLMVRRTFLFEALKTNRSAFQDVEQIATTYGLQFEKDEFMVIVRERAGEDFSDKILKYLNQLDTEDFIICWTQKQDLDIFLLNYDHSDAGLSIPEKLMKELEEQSSEKSRIVHSSHASYLSEIPKGYLDCLQQLGRSERTLIAGHGKSASRIRISEGDSLLGIFRNYLFDENYQSARQMLPELCTVIFNSDDLIEFTSQKYKLLSWFTLKKRNIPEELVRAYIEENSLEELQGCIDRIYSC